MAGRGPLRLFVMDKTIGIPTTIAGRVWKLHTRASYACFKQRKVAAQKRVSLHTIQQGLYDMFHLVVCMGNPRIEDKYLPHHRSSVPFIFRLARALPPLPTKPAVLRL